MPDPQDSTRPDRSFRPPERDTPPPRIRKDRRKVYILIGSSAILMVLLLAVVTNIESGVETNEPEIVRDDVPELIPKALTDAETSGEGFDRDSIGVGLPEGGAIEVANLDGSIAQEYRFTRLNPNPEGKPAGWLEMDNPYAVIYGKDGQIITLSGDQALARAPNRALESGTLTGNVVIRIYQSSPGRRFIPGELQPTATVKTSHAVFDNQLGEIRCDDDVNIVSTTLELFGTGLRLQINDQENIAQLWEIDDIHYILFFSDRKTQDETAMITTTGGNPGEPIRPRNMTPPSSPAPTPDAPSQTAPPGAPASPTTDDSINREQFYLLTLTENVHIVQNDPATGRIITGDELSVVFSFKSQGLGGMFAINDVHRDLDSAPGYGASEPLTRTAWLASLALASFEDDGIPVPKEGETLLTCDGPLKMIPLPDPADRPASSTDARITVTGSPVVMRDLVTDAEAQCGSFIYNTENRRLQLTRMPDEPVTIESPDYAAEGDFLWLDQSDGTGGFEGPGWLASREHNEEMSEDEPAHDDDEKQATGNPLERLRVYWDGGVDLKFRESGRGEAIGPLQRATFKENVRVRSEEGTIDSDTLDLAFTQNDLGETIPDTMTATGNARLRSIGKNDPDNSTQTIWSDMVHVTFMESKVGEETNPATETANPFGGKTQVRTLTAEGDVQVLLADGARVFADLLEGNAEQEEITLRGENIVLVSGQVLIEHGTKVHLIKSSGTADWPGPGQARIFTRPLDMSADRRIKRPVIANDDPENPRQLRARWNDSLHYDSLYNDGAGKLLLTGDVDARSTPSPLDYTNMTGDELELRFTQDFKDDTVETNGVSKEPEASDRKERRLKTLIARGDARIESRHTYENAPDVKPRVFYIAGDHIEYDDINFEALVEGAGELLMRDLLPDADRGSGSGPFSSKGTTSFKWQERLEMTHLVDEHYQIVMNGDVQGLHLNLEGQSATISGDQIAADVTRSEVIEQSKDHAGSLLVGSDLTLRNVRGVGAIFIRTPTRDVSCHTFEYNLATSLAHATAAPGGRVKIKTRNEPNPVYADRIDWNMVTDRIEVRRGSGTSRR